MLRVPSSDISDFALQQKLPEGWYIDNGILYFLAETVESCVVNGKDYNVEGLISREKQFEQIRKDLYADGFTDSEIDGFLAGLPVQEWSEKRLSFEDSWQYLRQHPEYRQAALERIAVITEEIKNELRLRESGRRRR